MGPPSRLESLPNELKLSIINELSQTGYVTALIHASPVFYVSALIHASPIFHTFWRTIRQQFLTKQAIRHIGDWVRSSEYHPEKPTAVWILAARMIGRRPEGIHPHLEAAVRTMCAQIQNGRPESISLSIDQSLALLTVASVDCYKFSDGDDDCDTVMEGLLYYVNNVTYPSLRTIEGTIWVTWIIVPRFADEDLSMFDERCEKWLVEGSENLEMIVEGRKWATVGGVNEEL